MNKILISCILLVFSCSVFSETSIDSQTKDQSYLLSAPGTVTGRYTQPQSSHLKFEKTPTNQKPAFKLNNPQLNFQRTPMRYRYVGEQEAKFRQFGQKPGNNNPWSDDFRSRYYSLNLSPGAGRGLSNPWQLDGMPSFQGMDEGFYPGGLASPYSPGPDQLYGNNQLYPDFPDEIYRDANPAAFAPPGHKNGYMPGFGRDSFNLPFSPFGMF